MGIIARTWQKIGFLFFIFLLIASLFEVKISFIALLCMLIPVYLAATGKRRLWCRLMCPRGNYYDNIVSRISRRRPTSRILKSKLFKGVVFIFAVSVLTYGLSRNLDSADSIAMILYRFIIITTIVGTVFSYVFSYRTWCTFCPTGTLSNIIISLKKK